MDFLRRGDQPQTIRTNGGQHPAANTMVAEPVRPKRGPGGLSPRWLRVASIVLLFSLAIMALSISTLFYFSRDREGSLVDTNKYQAVFLTNGQVYFGQVKDINPQFVDLQDIFYLNSNSSSSTSSSSTPTSFTLVKLGCELHAPLDQMIINQQQVSFWENLSSSGKVAQGITQWYAENPHGQNCSTSSSNSTQQSASTSTPSTATTDSTAATTSK